MFSRLLCLLGLIFISPAAFLFADTALPRIDGITPDGDLADWGTRGLRLPFLTSDSPLPTDPARSHVEARFAWDDAGLLLGVEVTDKTPSEAPSEAAAYMFDSVELFLAPDATRWESLQLVLSPGRDHAAHPAPRSYVFDNRPAALQSLPRDVTWAVKPHADGYVVEARLPWASLGIQPAPGVTVATRLFVNDDNGLGVRTRFVWQPAPDAGRFYTLTLAAPDLSAVLDAPVAWTALDVAADAGRVNIIGTAGLVGSTWTVRQGDAVLGLLIPTASGKLATGTLALPAGRDTGPLTLNGPDNTTLIVRDTLATAAASAVITANAGWRVSRVDKTALAFARAEFPEHVFAGRQFPVLNFIDADRVTRLLGASPVIKTRWLDAQGKTVNEPEGPGLYAARSELTLKGRTEPLVLENEFYHLPDLAGVPPQADETSARLLAFALQGADATPSQAARVTERWWHAVRRASGWSQALRYKIHLPEGASARPRPLIMHLHGTGQFSDTDAEKTLAALSNLAGPEPIIVYAQSRDSWRGPAVAELIDTLMKTYDIDADRVYLMGFSMGGIGSWEVALDMPERFAAVVPIGGRMGSPADAARLRDVPLWVFNGADDPTTTAAEAEIMVEAVRRAGGEPRLTLLPGRTHGDSQAAAYAYPGLFEWMLSQRRPH